MADYVAKIQPRKKKGEKLAVITLKISAPSIDEAETEAKQKAKGGTVLCVVREGDNS